MIELVAFIAVVVVGGYFLFLMIVTENEGSVSDFLGGPPYFRGILGVLFPISVSFNCLENLAVGFWLVSST